MFLDDIPEVGLFFLVEVVGVSYEEASVFEQCDTAVVGEFWL